MSPTCPSQNKNFWIKDEIMATHFRWWGLFWPHFPQQRITFFLIQKLYVCVFSQDRLIEWWFLLLFHFFFGDKYQINKPQHYNLQSWPCTSRSHDFERELTCVWFQCSYIEEFLLVYNLLRVYKVNYTSNNSVTNVRDLILYGHVTMNVTLPISAYSENRTMIIFCFAFFLRDKYEINLLELCNIQPWPWT